MRDPTDAANGGNPPRSAKQRLDPSGIRYTPSSGIWQPVWLEPVASDHVDGLKLTPDLGVGTLTVPDPPLWSPDDPKHIKVEPDRWLYWADRLGLAVPGHAWSVQVSEVEGELNGLLTYDRAVLKPDAARLEAAHEVLIRDASRVTPTGCPAPQPVLE